MCLQTISDGISFIADPKYGLPWEQIYERDYLTQFALALRRCLAEQGQARNIIIISCDRETNLTRNLDVDAQDILIVVSDEQCNAVQALSRLPNVILTPYWDDKKCSELKNVIPYPLGCPSAAWPPEEVQVESAIIRHGPPSMLVALNWNLRRLKFFFPIFRLRLFEHRKVKKWIERRLRKSKLNQWATFWAERQLRRNLPDFDLTIKFYSHWAQGFPYEEYLELLRRSDFCLCLGGWVSPITYRHIEAAVSSSLPISEPLPNIRIYPKEIFRQVVNAQRLYRELNQFVASGGNCFGSREELENFSNRLLRPQSAGATIALQIANR